MREIVQKILTILKVEALKLFDNLAGEKIFSNLKQVSPSPQCSVKLTLTIFAILEQSLYPTFQPFREGFEVSRGHFLLV